MSSKTGILFSLVGIFCAPFASAFECPRYDRVDAEGHAMVPVEFNEYQSEAFVFAQASAMADQACEQEIEEKLDQQLEGLQERCEFTINVPIFIGGTILVVPIQPCKYSESREAGCGSMRGTDPMNDIIVADSKGRGYAAPSCVPNTRRSESEIDDGGDLVTDLGGEAHRLD